MDYEKTKWWQLCNFEDDLENLSISYTIFVLKSLVCKTQVVLIYVVQYNFLEIFFYTRIFSKMKRYVYFLSSLTIRKYCHVLKSTIHHFQSWKLYYILKFLEKFFHLEIEKLETQQHDSWVKQPTIEISENFRSILRLQPLWQEQNPYIPFFTLWF